MKAHIFATAALTVIAALGGAAAPAGPAHQSPVVAQAAPVPAPAVTFASEGDSISALADNNRKTITWSWVRDAVGDGGLKYIGVYMRAGAATPELLAHAVHTKAQVMVVMAGTNDVSQGIPTATTLANITGIFARAGAPHNVLSAIAPRDQDHITQTLALNAALQQLAAQHRWTFVDPWTPVRMPNGTYKPGTNADRIHPATATGALVGKSLHRTIIDLARP